MTGLSAGIKTGWPVFEAQSLPGGICSSYYALPGQTGRFNQTQARRNGYRFEYGGGHWIFGGDAEVLSFIEQFTSCERYRRKSSVYLPDAIHYVPYPLQYHLAHVPASMREAALEELQQTDSHTISTMADWVAAQFGPSLNQLFFAPFHELYTAGLWNRIRPQDNYKTPLDKALVLKGAVDKTPDTGYNATFVYPREGLDQLALRMTGACDVRFGKKVTGIDTQSHIIHFADKSRQVYDRLFSSLPLNEMLHMTGLNVEQPADPHTSVLVLNIGAVRGPLCPDDHWIYVPESKAGFHRVGFYSNVDAHFLPEDASDRVSLYIEKAFLPDRRPSIATIKSYEQEVVSELRDWGMIGHVDVIDSTWIEVAYTWSWPGSTWKESAIQQLAEKNITMLGRYGRWHFQGIAASIREGMELNKMIND